MVLAIREFCAKDLGIYLQNFLVKKNRIAVLWDAA
jgi:hypothetical protein